MSAATNYFSEMSESLHTSGKFYIESVKEDHFELEEAVLFSYATSTVTLDQNCLILTVQRCYQSQKTSHLEL